MNNKKKDLQALNISGFYPRKPCIMPPAVQSLNNRLCIMIWFYFLLPRIWKVSKKRLSKYNIAKHVIKKLPRDHLELKLENIWE